MFINTYMHICIHVYLSYNSDCIYIYIYHRLTAMRDTLSLMGRAVLEGYIDMDHIPLMYGYTCTAHCHVCHSNMTKSRHTCGCITSHTRMRHVTHTNSCRTNTAHNISPDYFISPFSLKMLPPQKFASTLNPESTVQIQIGQKNLFRSVPRDTGKSEFSIGYGGGSVLN